MATGINNTLTGLASLNLKPTTGGTTTAGLAGSTGGNFAGITQGTGVSTPIPSTINTTGLISPPKSSTSSPIPQPSSLGATGSANSSGGTNSYGLTASSPNWYQLQPGESTANYNARVNTAGNIAAATGMTGATGNTANTGSGTGGGSAPAGMMYDGQGNLVPQSTYSSSNPATLQGLVNTTANTAGQPSNQYNQAQNTAANAATSLLNSAPQQDAAVLAQQKSIQDLENQYATQTANISGTPGDLSLATGDQGILYNKYSGQLNAQEEGLANILQGNAQQQAAYTGAGNVANTSAGAATGQQSTQQQGLLGAAGAISPQQVPYSSQFLNPASGQPIGGGGANNGTALSQLPTQAQNAVASYAQQIQNGSMTRADAESRLSAYGVVGTNALNEVLGNGFNTNASNASAGTTAVGQQIQTAANSTNAALDTLGSSFSSLPGFETGGVPITNSIANWIASQFGSSALQTYKTNLADARSQLIGVLNSSGGTPTGNEATANQYLPDDMTQSQFNQNVGTVQNPGIVRQLISQKVGAFTQSGQQNNGTTNSNTTSGSSPTGWF